MAHTISQTEAKRVLATAAEIARSDTPVDEYWERFAEDVFQMDAKTYTPALGAALLAKATNPSVDPLSIKAEGERGYSLRTVGHSVLVPAAQTMGFSIRTTGREPLNNQPFFRYSHMTRIERVRNREQLDWFVDALAQADNLDDDGARLALAAFLRVAFRQSSASASVMLDGASMTHAEALRLVAQYIAPGTTERPKKLQAIAAAAYDLTHHDVRTRRINDPSRDCPGDIQAYVNDVPFLAVEVRGKPVPITELDVFVTACVRAGITRVSLLVDAPNHDPIDRRKLRSLHFVTGAVHLAIYESTTDLVEAALEWADEPQGVATHRFTTRVVTRLQEIEVSSRALREWMSASGG